MNDATTYERDLTTTEIHERRLQRDDLDDQLDQVRGEIAEHKREIKEAQVEQARLESRIFQLRWEIRRGKVTLPRQAALPLDRVTLGDSSGNPVDDPRERPFCDHKFVDSANCLKCGIGFAQLKAESLRESQANQRDYGFGVHGEKWPEPTPRDPETADTLVQRPEADTSTRVEPDLFAKLYPAARDHTMLLLALATTLTDAQYHRVEEAVVAWHPDSGIFQAVAHFARTANAWADAQDRAAAGEPGIAGLHIPHRVPMPDKLSELLGLDKRAKPARKKRSKKA